MNWKKGLIALGACVLAVGLISGCGGQKAGSQNAASQAAASHSADTIVVATNPTYVPFEFKTEDGNDYQGYEIDVVRAVAREMNKKVDFKNISFDGLIPALQSGKVDMSASGMTATKERAEKILFAAPFYETKLSVVTPVGSDLHSVEDVKNSGEVAVQVGTVAADYAKSKDMQIRQFDHSADIIMELKAGGAKAGILDKPAADYFVANEGKGKFVDFDIPDSQVQYFAFGFKKDNTALQKEVNAAIKTLKDNGTLNELHEKWFHTPLPQMPDTAEEALGL